MAFYAPFLDDNTGIEYKNENILKALRTLSEDELNALISFAKTICKDYKVRKLEEEKQAIERKIDLLKGEGINE